MSDRTAVSSVPLQQENHSLVRAAGVIGIATFSSRILGFIRDMVLARLFGATEASREHLGTQLLAAEKARHEASVAALKQILPAAELQEAWEAGRAASPWELIESSLQNA